MEHIHGSKELRGRLKEWGFDVQDLLKCMAAQCDKKHRVRERGEKHDAGEQQDQDEQKWNDADDMTYK